MDRQNRYYHPEDLKEILGNSLPAKPGTQCPSPEDLARLIDGRSGRKERDRLYRHLARCEACYQAFRTAGELSAQTGRIRRLPPRLAAVAPPPETHLEVVQRLAERGVRVIVCEKPLAPDARRGARIAGLCGRGVTVLTNHERRYSADYRWVRDRVADRRHGELLSMAGRVYMGSAPVLDMLLEDGTHLVDAVRFLHPVRLELERALLSGACLQDAPERERQTLQVLARQDRVPVYLEVGAGREYAVFELELAFRKGMVRVGNGLLEEWASGPSRFYSGFNSLRRTGVRRPRVTGYFRTMLADAVRCLREGSVPVSSAGDGLEALRFIDRVVEAVRKPG